MTIRSRALALAALAATTTLGVAAQAWQNEAVIITSIHDHKFDRIETKRVGDGCEVEYVLHFGAPAARYTDPAPVRNYYRFKARVSLSEGHRSFSPQFANRVPGRRVYRWKHDTTAEGCWAQKPHKVFYVDVEGCRNRNCKVEPFK